MELVVNGEPKRVPDGLSVEGLLAHLAVEKDRVAVEVDRQVVPKSDYPSRRLAAGAKVEIVQFVGGG